MSVIQSIMAIIRPFMGFEDPGLPTGVWMGRVSSLGDGTGGLNRARIEFQASGGRTGQYFSLEQIMCRSTRVTVADNLRFQISNMDPFILGQSNGAFADTYLIPIQQNVAAFAMVMNLATAGLLPLFLGTPDADGNSAGVSIEDDNVVATSVDFRAQGYVWGPRSVLSPGGLRRPIDGLYAK